MPWARGCTNAPDLTGDGLSKFPERAGFEVGSEWSVIRERWIGVASARAWRYHSLLLPSREPADAPALRGPG